MILAIDPGNVESAYVVVDNNLKPVKFGKVENELLRNFIVSLVSDYPHREIAIEMIAHYGSNISPGKEVFDTCVWIGRFAETARHWSKNKARVSYVYRKDEKIHLCGTMKAKDNNIRRALIDRFAKHDLKNGKGVKANPDWFYGFRDDIWQAYAVAVTYMELKKAV